MEIWILASYLVLGSKHHLRNSYMTKPGKWINQFLSHYFNVMSYKVASDKDCAINDAYTKLIKIKGGSQKTKKIPLQMNVHVT